MKRKKKFKKKTILVIISAGQYRSTENVMIIVYAKYLQKWILKKIVAQLIITKKPQYILLLRILPEYSSPSILLISVHLYIST